MVLLRRVIGDALRARRQGQHRTLREVSTAANVSLGYLSEIERGQKEASSELLSAICDALGAQLSDVLRQVSDTLAMAEEMDQVLAPVGGPTDSAGGDRLDEARADRAAREERASVPAERVPAAQAPAERVPATAVAAQTPAERVPATAVAAQAPAERVPTDRVAVRAIRLPQPVRKVGGDGEVTVSVRHDTALRTTLKATRPRRANDREREIVYA
jgi:transcriptional regulator with XRE-family HTH domain